MARVPPNGSTVIHTCHWGVYEDSVKWIELPPCIAGKASSLQSHEGVELYPLEIIIVLHFILRLTLFSSKLYADHEQSSL